MRRVLLLETNPSLRRRIEAWLDKLCELVIASSDEEAIAYFDEDGGYDEAIIGLSAAGGDLHVRALRYAADHPDAAPRVVILVGNGQTVSASMGDRARSVVASTLDRERLAEALGNVGEAA